MNRKLFYAGLGLALFVILFVVDQLRSPDAFDLIHFLGDLLEAVVLVAAIALTSFVSVEARDLRRERRLLLDDLGSARREGERWRAAARAHVSGLSQAIAAQFRGWDLTEAEADVAGLMLKGLSHKEIGTLRDGAEATVRQHAAVVYRKSGLSSRTQLAAFFLEDLLMPADAKAPSARPLALVRDADRR